MNARFDGVLRTKGDLDRVRHSEREVVPAATGRALAVPAELDQSGVKPVCASVSYTIAHRSRACANAVLISAHGKFSTANNRRQ
jgi:hypothetical protein